MARLVRPTTFDDLRALLAEREIDTALADACRPGAVLVPDAAGRSRIGGLPRLAPGVDWPRARDGRVPHIASIALDDLPATVRPPLDGELSFFINADEWWHDVPDTNFAVRHTPAALLGELTPSPFSDMRLMREPESTAPSDDPPFAAWREVRLSPRPSIVFPWEGGMPWASWLDDHFDEDDLEAFCELAEELDAAEPATSEWGHVFYGDPPQLDDGDDELPVLLQLASQRTYDPDDERSWIFGDVWTLLIRGDLEAFRRGDFSSVVADYSTA